MWTVSFVEPILQVEPICDRNKIASFTAGFSSRENLSNFLEEKFLRNAVISNWRSVGTKTEWQLKFFSSSSTTIKTTPRFL